MTIAGSRFKKYESGKEILLTRRGDFLIAKALQMGIDSLQTKTSERQIRDRNDMQLLLKDVYPTYDELFTKVKSDGNEV